MSTQQPSSHTNSPLTAEALQAFPFPLSLYSSAGQFVAANQLAKQLFQSVGSGTPGAGAPLTASGEPVEPELFEAAVQGQQAKANPAYYSWAFPGALDEPGGCWVETSYLPFTNPAGQVTHVGIMRQDVTGQVMGAEETRLLKQLIENASDGIAATELSGKIYYGNPSLNRMFGETSFMNNQVVELIATDDAFRLPLEIIKEQGSWRGEMSVPKQDGSILNCDVSAFLLTDTQGKPQRIGAIIRDLSERHAQQKQLKIFQSLVEQAPDAIGIWDLQGRAVYANNALRKLHEREGESLLGSHWQRMYPESAYSQLDACGQEVMAKGACQAILEQIDLHGRRIPMQGSFFLLYDEQGEPSSFVTIFRDISEQQASQKRLRMFEALVDNAALGMAIGDLGPNYTYVNAALRDSYGYGDAMIGMNFGSMVAPEDEELYQQNLATLVSTGRVNVELRLRHKNGQLCPTMILAILIFGTDGAPIAIGAILRDLTEERNRENERVLLQQQVIEAQQAALRELSTPLIPIAEGIVAMPLIGSIDSSRAQLVIETLLNGVSEMRASTTILDITGVSVVDTQVASALLRAAQAIKLLGAQVILTGIRPEVAQTLVGLGVDLTGIITCNTLQSGIARALR